MNLYALAYGKLERPDYGDLVLQTRLRKRNHTLACNPKCNQALNGPVFPITNPLSDYTSVPDLLGIRLSVSAARIKFRQHITETDQDRGTAGVRGAKKM